MDWTRWGKAAVSSAAAAWALAAILAYAGAVKIADPGALAAGIANYRLLPAVAPGVLALVLPWWELGAALALVWPAWRRAGGLIALGLAAVFTLAVGSAWARGLDIACGCFGSGSGTVGWRTLGLDLLMLLAALGALRAPAETRRSRRRPARPSANSPHPG